MTPEGVLARETRRGGTLKKKGGEQAKNSTLPQGFNRKEEESLRKGRGPGGRAYGLRLYEAKEQLEGG